MLIQGARFRNNFWFVVGLLFVLTALKDTAMAQDSIEDRNRRAVQAGFDNWRSGTGSVFDLLAPDAKWTIVGHSAASKTYQTRQEFMDDVIRPFNARLSSRLVPTVRGVYADGNTVIVLWDGVAKARDGKAYENSYSWFLQMQGGRIVSATAFYDSIAFNDLWTRVKPVE
uniref:SnoaL-like domain-containing protein n=1 Tax=uncultured bacterium BLR5 TaxID=506522 RepID=C0INU4_9BACT|nr:conserved hypothetical protein [uncultured bacterium BLR5]